MSCTIDYQIGQRVLCVMTFSGQMTWDIFSDALLRSQLNNPDKTLPVDVIVNLLDSRANPGDGIYFLRHAGKISSENPRLETVLLVTRSATATTLINTYLNMNPARRPHYQLCTSLEQAHAILERIVHSAAEDHPQK